MSLFRKIFLKLDLIVFLELASYIFNFSTHKKNQLNTFQRFLISKLYSLGYEAYFRKLNFLKAYKFKLYESLNVLEGRIDGDQEKHRRYLKHIFGKDLDYFLQTEIDLNKRITALEFFDSYSSQNTSKKINFKNILYIGPKANIQDLDLFKYDLIISNKLLPDEALSKMKNVFIITGNLWLSHNMQTLKKKQEAYSGLKIFSTLKSDITHFPETFRALPSFPRGESLMNLQRTLYFILNEIGYESLEILGFDLFTTAQKKNNWYNLQAIKIIKNEKQNYIYSLMRHDYLLNLITTKKLMATMPNIIGSFPSFIADKSISEFFKAFRENI